MNSVFPHLYYKQIRADSNGWAGGARRTEEDCLVSAAGLFKAEGNYVVLRCCSKCQAPESRLNLINPVTSDGLSGFTMLDICHTNPTDLAGSWVRALTVIAIWCSFCPALNLNGLGVHGVEQVFAANTETHQTCDETSPIDTLPASLWWHPATTTYSTYWCVLESSSRKVVWTLLARRILGLTRFSAVLPWRLGLTHAKLEESTSCIPSCYGPSWHLQSWLLKCNGLTTYRNFRAQGLSDTTWMPWMHWYRAAQAAIGEELHHYTSQNDAGFWMLWFDSSFGWCYAIPSTSCSFPHIRSWHRPGAKSKKSKISGISE